MSDKNIYQRMLAVMGAVDYVQKESRKVNNQYTFVSHDAVTAKIRAELVKNGIVTITRIIGHAQDGNRTEVDLVVDFVNSDKPDDRISVPAFGYGIDPSDKGPWKAISYAVKYAYLKSFALETGDDPERDNIEHKPTGRNGGSQITPRAGAWDSMSAAEKMQLATIAGNVRECLAAGEERRAYEVLTAFALDVDARVALWDRFSSSERSTLKRAGKQIQGAENAISQ